MSNGAATSAAAAIGSVVAVKAVVMKVLTLRAHVPAGQGLL
jgi:hypothetical protein